MASTLAFAAQPRPCVAFRPRTSSTCRRRAAAPVRAAAKGEVGGLGMASGMEIGGMRPTSPRAWELISTTLKRSGVAFLTPKQAEAALRKGTPVVDIRPSNEFGKGRLPGATNCQFYQPIAGWSPAKVIRRIGFTAFGVYGTEANPDFLAEVEAAVPKKAGGMILVCNIGGSLTPTGPSEFGRQSRSLTAAYELTQAGFKNIKVLQGGYNEWAKEEREIEVEN